MCGYDRGLGNPLRNTLLAHTLKYSRLRIAQVGWSSTALVKISFALRAMREISEHG